MNPWAKEYIKPGNLLNMGDAFPSINGVVLVLTEPKKSGLIYVDSGNATFMFLVLDQTGKRCEIGFVENSWFDESMHTHIGMIETSETD